MFEQAFLFLQHCIRMLKPGGRAAVVIKNTFLSNTDNASLRRKLLADCNLHAVLDRPSDTFQGTGVKTVVLFFEKGAPTRRTWFYQLDPGRSLGKPNPLNDAGLAEFVELQKTFADSAKSNALFMMPRSLRLIFRSSSASCLSRAESSIAFRSASCCRRTTPEAKATASSLGIWSWRKYPAVTPEMLACTEV